jgi:hypothetical protein
VRLVLRLLGADVLEFATGQDAADDDDKLGTADLSGTTHGDYERAEDYGRPDTTVSGGWEPDDDRGPRVGFRRR